MSTQSQGGEERGRLRVPEPALLGEHQTVEQKVHEDARPGVVVVVLHGHGVGDLSLRGNRTSIFLKI